jgi:hydroxymethylbilane synthase
MNRLGFSSQISEYLSKELSIPDLGQRALGIESRIADNENNESIDFFNHPQTAWAVKAERAVLRRLEGGCQVPIGAFGSVSGGTLTLTGFVSDVEGQQMLKKTVTCPVEAAEATGISLGDDLLILGAGKILNEVYQHETFNVTREDV